MKKIVRWGFWKKILIEIVNKNKNKIIDHIGKNWINRYIKEKY